MNIRNAYITVAFIVTVGIGMGINVLILPLTRALWSGTIHQAAVDSMVGAGWAEVIAWRVVDGAYAITLMWVIGLALTWAFLSPVFAYIGRNVVSRW